MTTIRKIYQNIIDSLNNYADSSVGKWPSRNDTDADRETRRSYARGLAKKLEYDLADLKQLGGHVFDPTNKVHELLLKRLSENLEFAKTELSTKVKHLKSFRGIVDNEKSEINAQLNSEGKLHGITQFRQQRDICSFHQEMMSEGKTRHLSLELD